MRSRDKERLSVLRQLTAAVKQVEIDQRITLDDSHVLAVLDKQLKQRRDSQSQFENAGRMDLAEKEAYEIDLIQEFMPATLTAEEIEALIDEAISSTGAASIKDMGKVMGSLKPRMQGRADLGAVSAMVKQRLG